MENKKVIIGFAVVFSILFSVIYLMLFSTLEKQMGEQKVLYMIQVGLFDKKENAKEMQTKLSKDKIHAYVWDKGKQIAVVCGISEEENNTKKIEKKLKEKNMSYVEKKVIVKNKEVVKLIENKEYGKVLEKIKDEG